MVVEIPQVEPKDWHHPKVLSDIISPYITPTIYPAVYTVVCVCVCVKFIHMCLYTYVYSTYDTDTQRHRPYTPIPPIPPIPPIHNTINTINTIFIFLLFIKVNFNFGAEKFFKKFFSPYTKTPPLKVFWCLRDSHLVPQKW